MPLKHGTICSKHDDIEGAASKAQDLLSDILKLVDRAKDDGQRMENGLDEKRKRIEELEAQVGSLEDDLRAANRLIEDLQEEAKNYAKEAQNG